MVHSLSSLDLTTKSGGDKAVDDLAVQMKKQFSVGGGDWYCWTEEQMVKFESEECRWGVVNGRAYQVVLEREALGVGDARERRKALRRSVW